MCRVVITEMGIASCLGNSNHAVVEGLRHGRSGIEFIPERKNLDFRSGLGGRIKDPGVPEVTKRNLDQMGPQHILVSTLHGKHWQMHGWSQNTSSMTGRGS